MTMRNLKRRFRKMNYSDYSIPLDHYQIEIGMWQKADLAFQANVFCRWSPKQMSEYISSLVCDKAPSKFIFADVAKCLEVAKERGLKEDIAYYQKWFDKGTRFLNIDSNNRNNVITSFMKGEIPICHGEYEIDGAKVIVDSDCDTYETLPQIVRDAFDNAMITVSVYVDATRDELSELFICVNEGKPLNEMEKLNAYITACANTIRELVGKYEIYFANQKKWFTPTNLNRRSIDEVVADCAFVYSYGLKVNINRLRMYRDGSDAESSMPGFRKVFNSFMKDVMTEKAYGIANRNSIFDLFVVYMELYNQKRVIKDNEEFLKSYMKVVSNLLLDEELYQVPGAKYKRTFSIMIGGRQLGNNMKRHELIMERFDIDSLTIQKDSKRTYTTSDKMIIASLNDFKTHEGYDIDLSKLHTNEYHGAHKIAHTHGIEQGGTTTIDNGAIQTKEDNLSTGSKNLE